MRSEKDVKEEVKKVLKSLGAWWYMPVQMGYGVKGIPDFIGCYEGKFFGIETKFGKNTESTWQVKQGTMIKESGGLYIVINEKNVDQLCAAVLRLNPTLERAVHSLED